MVIVYLDVGGACRNSAIYRELDRIAEGVGEHGRLMVIGDFNGHVGFLGEQPRSRNG